MILIAVEELRPGMVIALDVVSLSGHPIMTAGTELTPEHLLNLDARGITRIAVAAPPEHGDPNTGWTVSATPNLSPAMKELYRHVNLNHPFIHELARLCAGSTK